MLLTLRKGERVYRISIEKGGKEGTYHIELNGESIEVEVLYSSIDTMLLNIGERNHRVYLVRDGNRIHAGISGKSHIFDIGEEKKRAGRERGDEGEKGSIITPPMPGKIVKVLVNEGAKVRKNETLLIVESMKMENEVKATRDGVVRRIHFGTGDMVDTMDVLLEIE